MIITAFLTPYQGKSSNFKASKWDKAGNIVLENNENKIEVFI